MTVLLLLASVYTALSGRTQYQGTIRSRPVCGHYLRDGIPAIPIPVYQWADKPLPIQYSLWCVCRYTAVFLLVANIVVNCLVRCRTVFCQSESQRQILRVRQRQDIETFYGFCTYIDYKNHNQSFRREYASCVGGIYSQQEQSANTSHQRLCQDITVSQHNSGNNRRQQQPHIYARLRYKQNIGCHHTRQGREKRQRELRHQTRRQLQHYVGDDKRNQRQNFCRQ